MIRPFLRAALLAIGLACALAAPLARAQVVCTQSFQTLTVFLPGGGVISTTGYTPTSFVDVAPGSEVDLGVYCEGIGAFPPPVISGASYAWSTGATAQRIRVPAPAAGVTQVYSVLVTSSTGTKDVALSLRGASPATPICHVESTAAQPMKPGVRFFVSAVCSPAPTTYEWDVRSFTGKMTIDSGQGTATAGLTITDIAQSGEVLPVYLIVKIGASLGPYVSTVVTVGNPDVAVTTAGITAGLQHTCAATTTGGAKCWGNNTWGQLGVGRSIYSSTAPLNVIGNARAATVSSGSLHTCAKTVEGNARCWGENARGQLGDGNSAFAYFGVNVINLGPVTQVASGPGSNHTCAVTSSGTVKCWGANDQGQLGNGSTADAPVAVDATAFGSGIAKVATGAGHTCVVTNLGAVRCLGNNQSGQLGDNTFVSRFNSGPVAGLTSGVADIALGAFHSCALLNNGTARCWGRNQSFELGSGAAGTFSPTPVNVFGLTGATRISAGEAHTCAVAGGAARCWGRNTEGQVGDGTLTNRIAPVQVADLAAGVVEISAGGFHSCAVVTGSTALCWGRNFNGQLGDGTFAFKGRPSPVAAAANFNGQLDANNWFLRLDPLGSGTVPAAFVPKALAEAFRTPLGALSANVKYKASEAGKVLDNFVVAFVPAEFFAEVKTAPGTPSVEALRTKANGGLVFAQLTPDGWTTVDNQLIAYTRSTTNAGSGALNILDKTPLTALPPGTRFCVGYGEGSGGALGGQTFVEVQNVEGALTEVDRRPCILSGVYLHGLKTSKLGTPVTFGASIVGTSPSGTVQFTDNGAGLQEPKLVAIEGGEQGVARASVVATPSAGPHSIGAAYSGDSQNTWAQGLDVVPLVHTVSVQASVAVRGDASSKLGEETRFTATVTGYNPTGTVQFLDGAIPLGPAQVVREGGAVLVTSTLAAGDHTISAVYSGDANNDGGASPGWAHHVRALITTTLNLSSSPSPSIAGANAVFSVVVSGPSNPTGTVRYRNGDAELGQVPLINQSAGLGISSLPVGLHAISVDYLGDNNHAPATATVFHRVDPVPRAASTTALASSANPSTVLQTVNFTATVTGSPAPSGGTVTFRADAVPIPGCVARTLSGATATCPTPWLPVGESIVTAAYSGDAGLDESTSLALRQTVGPGTQLLSASPAVLDFGGQSMNTTSLTKSTVLTNTSPGTVTVSSVTAYAPIYNVGHNCGTLAPGASCTASVSFRPIEPVGVNVLLAIAHSGGGPAAVALRGAGERSLTSHYYQSILRRPPDPGGKDHWEGQAARVAGLGASVNETWFAMAQAFYFSGEYAAFNRDNGGFVTDLYNTFYNRAPDPGGLNFWAGQLGQGMPREVLLAEFMFSAEFGSFAQAIFGNTAARAEVNTVMDFYRGLLGRLPDNGGLNFWVGKFRAAQCQGSGAVIAEVEAISSQFALSGEYAARGRSHAQYVGDLYNAFLRRGGDLGGVQGWINQVASGAMTREQVRVAFRNSAEFQGRVNAIIGQGCMP